MSTQHDSRAQGRGPADAGRPAGPAPHPVPEDGSAWADGADDGAAAWDTAPEDGASAWDDGTSGAGSAASTDRADGADGADDAVPAWAGSAADAGWELGGGPVPPVGRDGDAPAAGGGPRSVWDVDAPAPASSWDDIAVDAPAVEPDDAPAAPHRRAPRAGRPAQRAAAVEASAAAASPATAVPDAGAQPTADDRGPVDEVAAVAARLAELVGRTGAARSPGAGHADPDDAGSAPATAPARRDRSGAGQRPGGARRGTGGRRRAPATEPPEDGPAAQDAEPDHESVARSVALRLLTGAPKSRHQLAEAMAKRDVPEEVADRVLDRFTEVGLVDDAAYAEILVRSRHTERGLSRRALAQELRRRGVDDETAHEALEQVDDADEEQAARALARKKLRATRGLDRETRLRRAYGALGRRGYGGSLVSRVVREELDAEGADDEAHDDADLGPGGFRRG